MPDIWQPPIVNSNIVDATEVHRVNLAGNSALNKISSQTAGAIGNFFKTSDIDYKAKIFGFNQQPTFHPSLLRSLTIVLLAILSSSPRLRMLQPPLVPL